MKLCDNFYYADKGRHFVLTEKGKQEYANYRNRAIGEPVDECDTEAAHCDVEKGYVTEVDIPGWTTLTGYEVVYYHKNHRLSAGNPQVFPIRKAAEGYKKHYEAYPWFDHELCIEETKYEGVPLSPCSTYNGKDVIDKEHYFGLAACETGEYFSNELIREFMDQLSPAYMGNSYFQMGEPVSHEDDHGRLRATYASFVRVTKNIWRYCGNCFLGEQEMQK